MSGVSIASASSCCPPREPLCLPFGDTKGFSVLEIVPRYFHLSQETHRNNTFPIFIIVPNQKAGINKHFLYNSTVIIITFVQILPILRNNPLLFPEKWKIYLLLIKVKYCLILLARKSFSVRLYFIGYVEETLRPNLGDVKENMIPLFVFFLLYYLP